MKKLLVLPCILLVFASLNGCVFFVEDKKATPEERMEAFMEDVNAERWDFMWKHFHPDSEYYDNELQTADNIVRNIFETHIPLKSLYVSGKTATCRSTNDSTQFLFTVIEYESDNYKIRYIDKTEPVFKNEY